MTAAAPRSRRVFGSLRARLVVGSVAVVAIVLVVAGAVGLASATATTRGLIELRLDSSLHALEFLAGKSTTFDVARAGTPPGSPFGKPMTEFVGQAPGSVIAFVQQDRVVDSALFGPEESARCGEATATVLASATLSGAAFVDLPDRGPYELRVVPFEDGFLVAGVSVSDAEAAIRAQWVTWSVLLFAALVLTTLGIVAATGVALRPLRRLGATAGVVARLPLDRGPGDIPVRIPARDTDPRSEVGAVGAAFNRMLDHVAAAIARREETDRRMRRFVTDASHELRTPLAAIRGYAELTRQESAELPEMTERSLQRIESESGRMAALVEELLLLARLDEGQDLGADRVDLVRVVADAVDDARAADAERDWELAIPDGPVEVVGETERLQQVVANLLGNARIHTPPGTLVRARLAIEEESAVIEVADDGPGIPAEVLPHVFERFARGDDSRSRRAGGTGLGLAIVDSIVRALGGRVTAASDGGARFRVELPLAPGAGASTPEG